MQALDKFFEQHPDFLTANYYIEPGYDQPEKLILFYNWNDVDTELMDELEEEGYILEFDDEWYVTGKGGAVRTQPSSYGWQPSYHVTERGDIITIEDDPAEWIEAMLTTDCSQRPGAVPASITEEDLKAEGFTKVDEEYENGMHPGQTDDPMEIASELLREHEAVVFRITNQRQFDITFEVWYR